MTWRFGLLFTLGVALCACGDDAAVTVDASTDDDAPDAEVRPCWDLIDPIRKGVGILGTGYDQFEAMPTDLPLEYGSQGGFNLVANVRMQGLAPGDPANIFDPLNSRTRIVTYFADTGVQISGNSPFRVGYKPSDATTYEFSAGVPVIFETCWGAEHLIGRQLRVTLEIYDSERGYATDERVVTAAAPIINNYPTSGSPGCPPR